MEVPFFRRGRGWLLLVVMCGAAGCSSESGQPSGAGGGGVTTDANGQGQGMGQHQATLYHLSDGLFEVIKIVNDLQPAADATAEQQEAFRKALNGFRISKLKGDLLQYDLFMDSLSATQISELDLQTAEVDAWIDEIRACYPFSDPGTVQQLTPLLNQIEQHNDTLRAALANAQ